MKTLHIFRNAALAAMATLTLAGCEKQNNEPDTTPPTVESVLPANGATNQPISGNIVITFDEAMNTSVAGIYLTPENTGNAPQYFEGGTWFNGNMTLTIPYSGLAYATTYIMDDFSGFADAAGNECGDNNFYFTTMDDPATGGDTGYAVGDYWPDSTAPEGVVFWVKPGSDGTEGKVVGLEETYVAKWGMDIDEEAAGVTGIRSLTDGATATRNMIDKYKGSATFSTDYPAFHYVYSTVNGGDANGVWYLPARDELKMLCAGYSGKVYESIVDWTSNSMPDYESQECVSARAAFDAKLTAKGGMAIGGSGNPVAGWYLCSSEYSSGICFSFGFEDGQYSSDIKNLDGNIRWVRDFVATP